MLQICKMPSKLKNLAIKAILSVAILLLIINLISAFDPITLLVIAGLDLIKAVVDVLVEIGQRLIVAQFVAKITYDPILRATENLPSLILLNPEVMRYENGNFIAAPDIENMVNFMINILIPFYVFAFIFIGIYLIFLSASPMGRARAKSTLLKLIASVPIIYLTIPITQAILDMSEFLTAFVLNLADLTPGIEMLKQPINMLRDEFFMFVTYGYGPITRHLASAIMFCMPIFIIIFMRYFFIILYIIMFPLIIFMYAFHWTRRMGAMLFKQTIWWILSQFMMAVILFGISIAALSLPLDDPMLKDTFGFAGFVALAVAPVITMALVNWGEMVGMMRDLMFTPWISLGSATLGLGVESAAGEEEVSPPEPIGPPRIPPKT